MSITQAACGRPALAPRAGRMLAAAAMLAALAGCINLAARPPSQLLTLEPIERAGAGEMAGGRFDGALAVMVPWVPQRLDVARIPVLTGETSLAYLADAVWVQRPAQLFRALLAETIRARGGPMVLTGGEMEEAAGRQLSGRLTMMDYDAARSVAIVSFDALLLGADGTVHTRRFVHEVGDVSPDPLAVSRALNLAANAVAGEVAQWLAQQG